jgi:transposase, IS5 family
MKKQTTSGLFDEEFRLEKISKQNDPLEKLLAHIDFEIFRSILEKIEGGNKKENLGGRPRYNLVMMFKILVLQRYYNLSDDQMEYNLLDRLSFMRFLGLGLKDRIPDAKTIWLFRDELTSNGIMKELFLRLDKQLRSKGVIVQEGSMVDATLVAVPIQHNRREENEQIKNDQTPQEWKEHPNKLRQKDITASWVKQKGKAPHFGYKDHIKADIGSKIITNYGVTPANIPDNRMLELLLEKRDKHKPLYADSAYRSKSIEAMLEEKKVISRIHEQGYHYKKLTEQQRRSNTAKSRVRARVEHIFGFVENSMNGIFIRCRSLVRATTAIGLMNLTYNLFRVVQLRVAL